MVTKEQALKATNFHANGCQKIVGPRGGITYKIERYRKTGMTKTWVTRPNEFSTPVKWGFGPRGTYITHHNADFFHVAADCPIPEQRSH